MVRSSVVAALLTPTLLAVLWGDSFALCLGSAAEGVQARFYPAPPAVSGPYDVRLVETRRIVPSSGLPASVKVASANNNLDAVRHSDGRVYLAWRTAPDHFAGPNTVIQVVSSADERVWRLEQRLALGTDLREPRLLSLHGSLFLYVSRLGRNHWAFEPQGVLLTEKRSDGTWTEPEKLELSGAIAWRTRLEGGVPYMTAYRGGENIYRFNGQPLHVDLLTTADGRHWRPVDAARRSVYVGGGSEADFTLDAQGRLFGVIRNEAGDATGFGSKVCSARVGKLAHWSCLSDARKFDSPNMFRYRDAVYLVARRNVTRDGNYDLRGPLRLFRAIQNQLSYVTTAKRCALWRVDAERRVSFVLDLPSRGDTCFPAIVPDAASDQVAVYDYSSAIAGADLPWSVGQRQPTYIYRHLLEFVAR